MRAVAFALLFALAGAASAEDGVREINQASVSGDASALHIISEPGSYRLTSDLTAPPQASGIRIDVSNVTLDLNGFTITGAGGLPVPPSHGISGTSLTNVEIRNGTVRDFRTSGVHLPTGLLHRVIDVRVINNGNFGINIIGNDSFGGHLIRGCTALDNGTGIRIEPPNSLVLDSVVHSNDFQGLELGLVGFARNAVYGNGTDVVGGVSIGCNLIGGGASCPP
jgi:hypothetical protein